MSTMNLGTLLVQLNADSKGFAQGLAKASQHVEKFTKEMKKLSNDVAQVSGAMLAIGGAAVAMAASVDSRAAKSLDNLHKSLALVAVQVYDILAPAVKSLTDTFKSLADWIAGLDPGLKKQIATWATWVAGIAVASKVIGTVMGLLSGIAGAFGALASAIGAIGFLPLLAIVAAITAILALVVVLHRAWRKNWGGIQEVVADVVAWIQNAFTGLAGFFGKFWEWLIGKVEAFTNSLLAMLEVVEATTGIKIGEAGIEGLKDGFKGLFKDLRSGDFFSEAIKFGAKIAADIGNGIAEEVSIIKKEISDALGLGGGGGKARAGGHFQPLGIKSGALSVQGSVDMDGAAFEAMKRELDREAKAIAKHAADLKKARDGELQQRLQLISDLERAKTLGKASATGNLAGLSESEVKQVTADTGEAWSSLSEAQKNFGNFAARMGPSMLDALGKGGKSIGNIIQGAQMGGAMGAAVAAVIEVVQTMESFQALLSDLTMVFERVGQFLEPLIGFIFDFVGDVLAVVVEALAPIFAALQPLFSALKEPLTAILPILGLLAYLFQALAPIIEILAKIIGALVSALKPLIQGIFYVVKGVLLVIVGAITGLATTLTTIWNTIVEAIAGLAEFVVNLVTAGIGGKAVGDFIRKGKGDVAGLGAPMDALINATWDSEQAKTAETAATWDTVRATKDMQKGAEGVAEAFSNIPSGYKVALARFNSADPFGGSTPGESSLGGWNIAAVNVYGVTNMEQLELEVRRKTERRTALKTGSPVGDMP